MAARSRAAINRNSARPNVVFLLADQWRAQATGYAGDPNARTPNIDRLAAESIDFTNAVSCCPVCTPYRGSLVTGQYPLTHGLFLNDVGLNPEAVSIADCYAAAGYDTAYIGKWHIDGHGRQAYIPRERRQGFEYWKVLECTHNYNKSQYYAGDDPTVRVWDGYDAIAQTRDAQQYIEKHARSNRPFLLFLSWGPPHNPYNTAPEKYKKVYADTSGIQLRPNVPEKSKAAARRDLAGYYAHIAALDDCVGEVRRTLLHAGIADRTIVVFTSDHGDMHGSHGQIRKQRPWDESIKVPLLVHCPGVGTSKGRKIDMPINAPDLMPTLLGLSGVPVPATVEGTDYSGVVTGEKEPRNDAALIACYSPFGEWRRQNGGREYRGVRTRRYTYVRNLDGPWYLFDNERDPYQMNNLVNKPEYAGLQQKMETILDRLLKETNDEFLPGPEYIAKWGYIVDERGTVSTRAFKNEKNGRRTARKVRGSAL
ncbi:MAG: sulfatase [Candidatus Hydrogenedentes bacterium]|nr:sulfatase [Candidatus Hydrogenedentota bacterium]